MPDFAHIEQQIELLRRALNQLVKDRQGNLKHPDVVALSARLDHLIVEYERAKGNHKRQRK